MQATRSVPGYRVLVAALAWLPLTSVLAVAQETIPAFEPPAAQPPAAQPLTAQPPAAAPGAALSTYEQQLSYTLGQNIGRDMKANGIPVDLASLAAGIRDALMGAESKLNDQQRMAILQQFQQQMMQQAQAKLAANQQKGQAFLADNAKKPGVQVTNSGLQYRVVKQGAGGTPTAQDSVRCHYEGRLIDGSVFDSSYARGEPAVFPVSRVIAGWTEALQLMKVGDKWELFIPSQIAYGAEGRPPKIGPNETLLFTIELLAIE